MAHKIRIKRIYETPSAEDGYRILVDRLWPRGISKKNALLNEWNKAISPSSELREWFAHKPERFKEFEKKYSMELSANTEEINKIRAIVKKQSTTLLYAAKDTKMNNAVVLKGFLEK